MSAKNQDRVVRLVYIIIRPNGGAHDDQPLTEEKKRLIKEQLGFLAEAKLPIIFLRRKSTKSAAEKQAVADIIAALGLTPEQFEEHKGYAMGYSTIPRIKKEESQIKQVIKDRAGKARPTVGDCAEEIRVWMNMARDQLHLAMAGLAQAYGDDNIVRYIISFGEPTICEALAGKDFEILKRGDGVLYDVTFSWLDDSHYQINRVKYLPLEP